MVLILILLSLAGLLSMPLTFRARGRLCTKEQRLDMRLAWGWRLLVANIGINRGKALFRLRLAGIALPANRKNPETVRLRKKKAIAGRKKEKHGFSIFTISKILSRKFLTVVSGFLKKVFRSLKIRLRLSGVYGAGDPALTGLLAGLIAALNTGRVSLELDADFREPVLDISGETSGRIIPVVILCLAIRFLMSEPVRKLWWAWLKLKFTRRKIKEDAQYV